MEWGNDGVSASWLLAADGDFAGLSALKGAAGEGACTLGKVVGDRRRSATSRKG